MSHMLFIHYQDWYFGVEDVQILSREVETKTQGIAQIRRQVWPD